MMNEQIINNPKIRYEIDKKSFFGHSAVLLMVLSAVFRFIGCWGMWKDTVALVMHIILPIASCLLLILCILFLGRKGFFLSCIPVIMGVVFFIYKAFSFESRIHMVLCILLYIAVAVIYTGTVIGSVSTKWLLPPLFGLPFIYHIFVEDIPALSNTAQPVTFAAGMQEMSVLCIMAALFCVGMGLKKKVTVEAEPVNPPVPAETPAAAAAAIPAAADNAVSEAVPTQPEPAAGGHGFEPGPDVPCLTPEKTAEPVEAITPEAEAEIAARAAESAEIIDAEFEKA